MRQEAKQGLKRWKLWVKGNVDEATVPDDLPFDETDIIAEMMMVMKLRCKKED